MNPIPKKRECKSKCELYDLINSMEIRVLFVATKCDTKLGNENKMCNIVV